MNSTASTLPHESGSILVMDDDEMVRHLSSLTLGRFGYTVTTCSNGEEAISLYQSAKDAGTPFSVTILDLTIPGSMGGMETARHILGIDPEAVLIVASGYSEDPIMTDYQEYGFRAAIEKPYRAQDIAEVLHRIKPAENRS